MAKNEDQSKKTLLDSIKVLGATVDDCQMALNRSATLMEKLSVKREPEVEKIAEAVQESDPISLIDYEVKRLNRINSNIHYCLERVIEYIG